MQLGDHWHQPLGMAAADHLVGLRATHVPEPSNKAAVQAALDVSKARSMVRIVVTSGPTPQPPES